MNYIKGKFKNPIYESSTGYRVGLFRITETDVENLNVNKTITFTGLFTELNKDDTYIFYGEYVFHNRYGYQFATSKYEKILPEGKDGIIDFLTSPFVKGCGIKTALAIYDLFKDDTLEKIKENKSNLMLIPKMSQKKCDSIYNSIVKYFEVDEIIIALKSFGFTIKETMTLINLYDKKILSIIDENIYTLRDLIDFKKLDNIFLKTSDYNDQRRIKASIIEAMKYLTFANGDVYLYLDEIIRILNNNFNISASIDEEITSLIYEQAIIVEGENYYLIEDYLDEVNNAKSIKTLLKKKDKKISGFDRFLESGSKDLNTIYNEEQKKAIYNSLVKSISIITGGPGTGKSTIVKAILNIYSKINNINLDYLPSKVALLAPTGRASKRLSTLTDFPSSTIHSFLKWDKEHNVFGINEYNKLHYDLIIIDEVSMLDNHLLSSLFKGIDLNTQLIFVGDVYQLPSVGPGLILSDMINSNVTSLELNIIYRQSENSFIPSLANKIKSINIQDDDLIKKDDFTFIECSSNNIKEVIKQIIIKYQLKKYHKDNIQILAPMYKGENGIDNLNQLLQSTLNKKSKTKKEILIGDLIYREKDKVLNLVNDPDLNISNGDIGTIISINIESKNNYLIIDYYGNEVAYKKDMLNTITHAYAISIHKSQGSEFDHVIIPITLAYSRMLYNKLLYTGVSRAKKSLILIGSITALKKCVANNNSIIRKTTLSQRIMNNN